MTRLVPIESRCWKNSKTGATASIYGCPPAYSDAELADWSVVTVGYTVENTITGTVGCGRKPWQTLEEAQAFCDIQNNR